MSSSQETTESNGKDKKAVRFVVTGFGPFGGFPDNPTTVLANGLLDYLSTLDTTFPLVPSSMVETRVIETSAQGARSVVDGLYNETCQDPNDDTMVVVLLLGVAYNGKDFRLETCAYNDASFRIPDEQGFQPQGESILGSDHQVGKPLTTLLNVQALVEEMNDAINDDDNDEKTKVVSVNKTPAVVSTDPARFVCNYTYCYSLDKFQCSQPSGQGMFRCLFLHVPPFSVAPKEEQFWFVARLMKALYRQVMEG